MGLHDKVGGKLEKVLQKKSYKNIDLGHLRHYGAGIVTKPIQIAYVMKAQNISRQSMWFLLMIKCYKAHLR